MLRTRYVGRTGYQRMFVDPFGRRTPRIRRGRRAAAFCAGGEPPSAVACMRLLARRRVLVTGNDGSEFTLIINESFAGLLPIEHFYYVCGIYDLRICVNVQRLLSFRRGTKVSGLLHSKALKRVNFELFAATKKRQDYLLSVLWTRPNNLYRVVRPSIIIIVTLDPLWAGLRGNLRPE